MNNNRDGGKGDRPRPIPNWDHYATNWDKIFQKKQTTQECIEEDKQNKERWQGNDK